MLGKGRIGESFQACFENLAHGLVYYDFERSENVQPIPYVRPYRVCWALDFNVIDEIVLADSNTLEACRAFVSRMQHVNPGGDRWKNPPDRPPAGVDDSVVNPAKLPTRLADDICMNCHQGGLMRTLQPGKTELDFRPGTPLYETAAFFQLPLRKEQREEADLAEKLPPVRGGHHALLVEELVTGDEQVLPSEPRQAQLRHLP